MSFKCDVCGETIPNNIKPIKKVVETREKIYPPVLKPDKTIDRIPVGWEVVKEIDCCRRCSLIK